MSTYLITSFIPKNEKHYKELFTRLYKWVKTECINIEIEEILDSADYTKYSIDKVDVDKVLSSDVLNMVNFTYCKIKPLEVYGTLKLVGNRHGGGYYAKENSILNISLNERSIWGSHIRKHIESEDYEKVEEHKVNVLFSLSELFNNWVKLNSDILQYASLYTEDALRSRITSTIGYYTDYLDFVLDYDRILIESKSNHYFTEFYGNEEKYPKNLEDINDIQFYESFNDEERGDLALLINSLDQEIIDNLKRLNEEIIKTNLEKSLINNPDIIFTDLENGFILSTYPLKSLWTLYYDFLKKLKVSSPENLISDR